MWGYQNPVKIAFGPGAFSQLSDLIAGRKYALVTYPEKPFDELTRQVEAQAGAPQLIIDDVAPNPDYQLLETQTARFTHHNDIELIVALGGGSVIDSAKVFAAANGNFSTIARFLETKQGGDTLSILPVIAIPTTAGTGSEVTSWATVWSDAQGKKYSLAHQQLYPESALIDPELMLGKPYDLTLATGLDALSHSLESIWNINANPISARYAITASNTILEALPQLMSNLGSLELRTEMCTAAMYAGLAFSNTKTAIAHNLSYPITQGWGVQHGIACSFTLPTVLRSVIGIGDFREAALKEIFGPDLNDGADRLSSLFAELGIGARFTDYGVPAEQCKTIIDEAFAGERGRNFIGSKDKFLAAATEHNIVELSAA
ncbi:alcohol dehydrogenase [Chromatiales bacterium (ex Bugula neritina AB1)]|nr:alcohol dehydrogenase [Chromatiales bacterium (ex Bugula neritina AB1)]